MQRRGLLIRVCLHPAILLRKNDKEKAKSKVDCRYSPPKLFSEPWLFLLSLLCRLFGFSLNVLFALGCHKQILSLEQRLTVASA
jgi:hypothetical protein